MKIKENLSLRVVDDMMLKVHNLRLKINKNHESGKKGSFDRESELLDEYFVALQELVNYLDEDYGKQNI